MTLMDIEEYVCGVSQVHYLIESKNQDYDNFFEVVETTKGYSLALRAGLSVKKYWTNIATITT